MRAILKRVLHIGVVIALLSVFVELSWGWGFWAHRETTRNAITLLPHPLSQFFEKHRDEIIRRSVDPDLARKTDSLEQFNHYIDIDYYGEYPFSGLPRAYEDAARKFTSDTVQRYGLLPWKIAEQTALLDHAFRRNNVQEILHHATYLAHYVEDAHVPLHTTLNYDGQLSNQKGLHSRFESELPEKFGKNYEYDFPDSIVAILVPLDFAFETVLESYSMLGRILESDRRLAAELEGEALKTVKQENGRTVVQYSAEYYKRFESYLGGVPRERMEKGAVAVARYWYTAWVNAGKPPLPID